MTEHKNNGFSLIELSISIIIIGLLVAGISGGSKLIKQAELRAFIQEITNYETAYITFKSTYDAKPGDFANASVIWGTGCAETPSNCNGNGSGVISYQNTVNDETIKSMKHMSLAGLIKGSNSVIPDSWTGIARQGVELGILPTSKFDSGLCLNYGGTSTTEAWDQLGSGIGYTIRDTRTNYLVIGGHYSGPPGGEVSCVGVGYSNASSGIYAYDAFNIDRKIDDGKYSSSSAIGASTGKFIVDANDAFAAPAPNQGFPCRSGNADTYDLNVTQSGCVILYAVE